MLVMCIKIGDWVSDQIGASNSHNPIFGEICTVVKECDDLFDLLEYPISEIGNPQRFLKGWFIPLSEIDETEMVRELKREDTLVHRI